MLRFRLKELRETKGISQKQLAIALNISQGAIGNWESGTRRPNSEYIKNIADYFDTTTDYLLGADDISKDKLLDLGIVESAILDEIKTMSESEKKEVLKYIKFIKSNK